MRLCLIIGDGAHRPGIVLRIAKHCGAGVDKQLRHPVVVEIRSDSRIGRRAKTPENEGDPFLLDETSSLLHRLWRTVAIVDADEIEFAAVHAALLIDHLEVGGLRAAEHAIGGGGPAVGHGLADLDLGIGNTRRVGGSGGPKSRGGIGSSSRCSL